MSEGNPHINRLYLDCLLNQNPNLMNKFLENPEKFLNKFNINAESLKCPDEVHDALKKAQTFVDTVQNKLQGDDSISQIPALNSIAQDHFGQDLQVDKIPFGLKFSERVLDTGLDWTATGSGTITWSGWDGDGDVDG